MSDRSDDRKFPLRRLFGNGMTRFGPECCVRCSKPETNRVVLAVGDAAYHMSVLTDTGLDQDVASGLVADRWVEGVIPMLEHAREICAEAGHPEWAEDSKRRDDLHRHVPLAWRVCRGCATKAEPPLVTMNEERLNEILNDEEGKTEIPHVYVQKDDWCPSRQR
jgi:hypothetical protein